MPSAVTRASSSVERDGHLELLDTPTGDLEYDNAWGVRHIGAYPVHQAGIRGQGDQGRGHRHRDRLHPRPALQHTSRRSSIPEFNGTYQGGYDFVNNDADPMDDNGHGTHVAGILAADHNGYLVVGVAPGIKLWALKVLGASGSGDYSGLIAALDWSVTNHMDVVNISLGGHDVSAALATAVHNASMAGVTIVAAAGNVVTLNDLIYGCPVAYPAAYPEAIAVTYTGHERRPDRLLVHRDRRSTSPHLATRSSRPFRSAPARSARRTATPPKAGPRWRHPTSPAPSRWSCRRASPTPTTTACCPTTSRRTSARRPHGVLACQDRPALPEVVRLRDRQRAGRDPHQSSAAARHRRTGRAADDSATTAEDTPGRRLRPRERQRSRWRPDRP